MRPHEPSYRALGTETSHGGPIYWMGGLQASSKYRSYQCRLSRPKRRLASEILVSTSPHVLLTRKQQLSEVKRWSRGHSVVVQIFYAFFQKIVTSDLLVRSFSELQNERSKERRREF
jgi:hypothetical protein